MNLIRKNWKYMALFQEFEKAYESFINIRIEAHTFFRLIHLVLFDKFSHGIPPFSVFFSFFSFTFFFNQIVKVCERTKPAKTLVTIVPLSFPVSGRVADLMQNTCVRDVRRAKIKVF